MNFPLCKPVAAKTGPPSYCSYTAGEDETGTARHAMGFGSALEEAAAIGHRDMANFLLQHGNREAVGNLGSAMRMAVRGDHGDILRVLLKHGDRGEDFGGFGSALHEAVLSGHRDFVAMLLESGACRTRGTPSEIPLSTRLLQRAKPRSYGRC